MVPAPGMVITLLIFAVAVTGAGADAGVPADSPGNGQHRATLVLSVATTVSQGSLQHMGMCRMLESALQNRIDIEVLGLGAPWEGFLTKFHLILQRLAAPDVGPGTVVVFVDAYDVAFVHPLSVLVHKFLRSGHAVVFGGECNCFPANAHQPDLCDAHPKGSHPYQYLNSGTYIGFAEHIVQLLQMAVSKSEELGPFINDDQLLLMRLFAHPVYGLGLHVDAEGSLFQTFSTRHYLVCEPNRCQTVHHEVGSPEHAACNALGDIGSGMADLFQATGTFAFHNSRTGAFPSVLHFNGRSPSAQAAATLCDAHMWYRHLPSQVFNRTQLYGDIRPLGLWDLAQIGVGHLPSGSLVTFGDVCTPLASPFPRGYQQADGLVLPPEALAGSSR